MYLTHFNLKTKPFQISSDPNFLWLGEKHREALAMLHYGVVDNRGFFLLTGEVGTGKTVLINHLIQHLPSNTVVATLSDPNLSSMDFYQLLADGFKISPHFKTKGQFLILLRKFLYNMAATGKSVLLIIDEAQRLDHNLMEEIRVLSNIDFYNRKLINIFFAGQQEFNQILMQSQNRALAQRITIRFQIEPLSLSETSSYIRHRLNVAGSTRTIFSEAAIKKVFEYASGIPRLINILCDHAMLTSYVRGNQKVGASIIAECAQELRIPTQLNNAPAIQHTTIASRVIGIPSTFDQKKLTLHSHSVREKSIVAISKYLRPQKPPLTRLLYAAAAALIILIWGAALMKIYQQPGQRHDDDHLMYSSHIVFPGGVNPMYAAHKEKRNPSATKARFDRTIKTKKSQPPPSERPEPQRDHPRKPVKLPKKPVLVAQQKNTIKIRTPKGLKSKVPIRFDNANRIANHSLTTMNKVAAYLSDFPQRVVYIHGYAGKTSSSKYRRTVLNQRLTAIKTHLMGKGAYATQIKVITMGKPVHKNPADKRTGIQTVIEFPQYYVFSDYNPDK